MNVSRTPIAESYAFCHGVARRAGSSFYPCFMLLPRPKRRAMEALYAFMRHTDDLGDNPQPSDARRDAIHRWRASLDRALCGEPPAAPRDSFEDMALPALADTVRRFGIPPQYLHDVIDGVEMDLDDTSYETFDELREYCRRVASAVGLACIHIWGFRGSEAPRLAEQCGVAMQLTNILRDLKEDAERGRIYLPGEDFRRCGYSVEDLRRGIVGEPFRRLIALEAERARRLYHEGAELIDLLEPDGRKIFGMMMVVYHRLLERIECRADELLQGRVRLGRWQKLRIAARWLLLPPRRSALP